MTELRWELAEAPKDQVSLFDEAGPENVEGMYGSAPTLNPDDLPGAGKEFNAKVEAQYGKPEVYTAYAVAALQMMLAALEKSDGTREGVTGALAGASADGRGWFRTSDLSRVKRALSH